MKDSTVVLVGAGGFGRELICWARDAHAVGRFPTVSGFINDDPQALVGFDYDLPYLGTIADYQPQQNVLLLCGLGDPETKERVVKSLLDKGATFCSLIHPSVVIADSAVIGSGAIICPQSLVSADACVGEFVTVNALSSVGHDVKVGDFSTLSAHVDLTGSVKVGRKVFFGTGAKIMPRISIGDGAKIGAGAVVMRSVVAGATMFAVPARKL